MGAEPRDRWHYKLTFSTTIYVWMTLNNFHILDKVLYLSYYDIIIMKTLVMVST